MHNLGYRSHKKSVYIGTDHAGFEMKEKLVLYIKGLGYEVHDCGAYQFDMEDDYPDFISPVAKAVALNPNHNIGIILGGSGQGEAIVANRYPNVRAIVYYGEPSFFHNQAFIKISREHNDANVLSLAARILKISEAKKA